MDTILQYGLQGVIAYGVVGLSTLILKKKWNVELSSEVKLYVLITVAFLVGFVPADLGNMLFNHIKTAIAVGFSISTFNTVANKVGGA